MKIVEYQTGDVVILIAHGTADPEDRATEWAIRDLLRSGRKNIVFSLGHLRDAAGILGLLRRMRKMVTEGGGRFALTGTETLERLDLIMRTGREFETFQNTDAAVVAFETAA